MKPMCSTQWGEPGYGARGSGHLKTEREREGVGVYRGRNTTLKSPLIPARGVSSDGPLYCSSTMYQPNLIKQASSSKQS